MGWWNQNAEGVSFAGDGELAWGDGPADVVGACVEGIREEFRSNLDREPTMTELRAGIEFTLKPLEDELRP